MLSSLSRLLYFQMKQRIDMIDAPLTLYKVTAFATRKNGSELLVFHHPTAGVQVPAGTVETGETLEEALVRELFEETGLHATGGIKHLGTQVSCLSEERGVLLRSVLLRTEPMEAAAVVPETDILCAELGRGWAVRILERTDSWARVLYEEYDLSVQPSLVRASLEGWLPARFLASRLVRSFFHVPMLDATPDTWDWQPKGGFQEQMLLFRLFWTPLVPRPRLVAGQDEWLASMYTRLLDEATKPFSG